MAGREDVALHRAAEEPLERAVAAAPQIGGNADPVEVHVDRERGRSGVVAELPLLAADLRERHAGATEVLRDIHRQVSRRPELLEVLGEKAVLPVVLRSSLGEAVQHLLR